MESERTTSFSTTTTLSGTKASPGVDVLIVTAIREEFNAVLDVDTGATPGSAWRSRQGPSGLNMAFRAFLKPDGEQLTVAVTQALHMGSIPATMAAVFASAAYGAQAIAMCGVCAGRPGAVALGDVIIADRVWNYEDGSQEVISSAGGSHVSHKSDIHTYLLNPVWKSAAESFSIREDATWLAGRPRPLEAQIDWLLEQIHRQRDPASAPERRSKCASYALALEKSWSAGLLENGSLTLTPHGRSRIQRQLTLYPDGIPEPPPFRVHVGPIASGSKVVRDAEVFDRLSTSLYKVLGLEMEAVSIGAIAHQFQLPYAIVMKGVMDFANRDKDDGFKSFAAHASAECLIAFLRENLPSRSSTGKAASEATVVHASLGTPLGIRALENTANNRTEAYRRRVGEQLERAYLEREERITQGSSTLDVDATIRHLKMELRNGPALSRDDIIGNGRYRLIEEIGQGGFATVWKAYARHTRDTVAVKVLHGQYGRDESRRERFFRGARQMARLQHQGIVRIIEPECFEDGFHFYVMEYVEGGDLNARGRQNRMEAFEAVDIIRKVGAALQFAHAQGLVHRDVKPANILFTKAGEPKLTDFDLVHSENSTGGTRTGALGTALYLAPEMMTGTQEIGPRIDVYSLGMTLLFLLRGADVPWWERANAMESLSCPRSIKAAIARATDVRAEQRFSSIEAFCQALGTKQQALRLPATSDAARLLTGPPDDFRRASAAALATARSGIERLKALPAPRKAREALEIFDEATAALSDASARASVARHSHPDASMRHAAEQAEQEVEAFSTEISLDRGVYDVIASLDVSQEDEPTRGWVEKLLRDFRRAGVDRDEATRARVKDLQDELIRIGQEFDRNIREDVRTVELPPAALEGLPADYVRNHPPGTDGKVRITTDYRDSGPFMTYAKDGAAREKLWRANRNRAYPENIEVLQRLLEQRHELATLLGYANWAAYATEDKMIRSERNAGDFIEKLAAATLERSRRDYQALLERKRKDDPKATRVDPWDQGYLEVLVKAEQYSFDSQAVIPYLEYTRVKQGVLDITSRIFGVDYRRVTEASVWHPDVETYDVFQGSEQVGRFYLDMHPRADKYKHAAQFTLTTGKQERRLPEAVLMCHFPKPGAQPALMQHGDVETFFKLFGHVLHHLFGGHTPWAGLSGVRNEWDFIDAPPQMLEEWARDVDTLQTFAKHYQTNEPLPADVIRRVKRAGEFGMGMWVRQQMFYAALSLELYRRDPKGLDPVAVVRELQGKYAPFPHVEGTYFHLSFGHLDGYSAIYYTYIWSLVIAKDLFTVFQSKGLLNPEPAQAYRHAVLEPGGSKGAVVLVKDFLGRDYDLRAYEQWLNAG